VRVESAEGRGITDNDIGPEGRIDLLEKLDGFFPSLDRRLAVASAGAPTISGARTARSFSVSKRARVSRPWTPGEESHVLEFSVLVIRSKWRLIARMKPGSLIFREPRAAVAENRRHVLLDHPSAVEFMLDAVPADSITVPSVELQVRQIQNPVAAASPHPGKTHHATSRPGPELDSILSGPCSDSRPSSTPTLSPVRTS